MPIGFSSQRFIALMLVLASVLLLWTSWQQGRASVRAMVAQQQLELFEIQPQTDRLLQQAIGQFPQHPHYHNLRANWLLRSGQDASFELDTSQQLRPSWPETHVLMAYQAAAQQDIHSAVVHLQNALAYGPYFADGYLAAVDIALSYWPELDASQRQALMVIVTNGLDAPSVLRKAVIEQLALHPQQPRGCNLLSFLNQTHAACRQLNVAK